MEAKDDETRQALIEDRKALMENKKVKKDTGVKNMGDETDEEKIEESANDITSEFTEAVKG